ncbi:MAG TPA: hypothetical protein VFQ25_04775 [Ktedonobacterales bacterium]|nr:hypothetical protein [Ktedonobacterales bacterium]
MPGIVRALDQRARTRQSEFATFVAAPDDDEPRSGLGAIVTALLPITPHAQTWLAEDHWRLLGVAQARARPGGLAWDLAYLATMPPAQGVTDGAATSGQPQPSQDETLMALIQYALNAAIGSGVQRVFARIEDERPEMEVFGKLGFQRYARESTWALESAAQGLRALEDHTAASLLNSALGAPEAEGDGHDPRAGRGPARRTPSLSHPSAAVEVYAGMRLRPWRRHDGWGLLRLYDACTPRVTQLAEGLTVDEFTYTRAAGGRTWYLPVIEPASAAFVHESGPLMSGWLRLRQGRGERPHRLALLAHPDEPGVAIALLRFALRVFAVDPPRPVICCAREYETATIDALRAAGFERQGAHALLVRHLAARLTYPRGVPAFHARNSRVAYDVKGLGTSPTRLNEGGSDTLCQKSSPMISIPSSRRSPRVSPRR